MKVIDTSKTIFHLSNEEKEALYQEFKSRMEEEKCKPSKVLCMAESKTYMDNLYSAFNNEMKIKYPNTYKKHNSGFSNKDPYSIRTLTLRKTINWDRIRLLICRVFGVSSLKDLPDDCVKKANSMAQFVIGYLFDKNTEYVNELYAKLEKEVPNEC